MTSSVALSIALAMSIVLMMATGCAAESIDDVTIDDVTIDDVAIDAETQASVPEADSADEATAQEPAAAVPPTEAPDAVVLQDLVDVEGLRERFVAAAGAPRLILLLSPT